mgnify:CR=1 FL=1
MSKDLNKKEIERFSRQIILKDIGSLGQKKIKKARVVKIKLKELNLCKFHFCEDFIKLFLPQLNKQ